MHGGDVRGRRGRWGRRRHGRAERECEAAARQRDHAGVRRGISPYISRISRLYLPYITQAYDEGLKALLTPQARKLRSKLNLVDLAGEM